MKDLKIFCFIGYTLLLLSIFIHLLKNEKLQNRFIKLLNKKQLKIYELIVKERITIYISGTFIGFLLGFLYIYFFPKHKYKNCLFITILMVTKLLFYSLYPKSTYILNHLNTKKQIQYWTDIYIHMKKIWIQSIILSITSYYLYNKYINIKI